jgi:signal transduction histidine kinase
LTTALKALIKAAADISNIEFSSEIDELAKRLPKAAEINLYRIVQEAVNNVVKHSQATEASVSLKQNGRTLDLTIEDNGRGFAPDAENPNYGLGLVGISERAKMLDAQYEINSSEKGTTIKLQMNLPAQKNGK